MVHPFAARWHCGTLSPRREERQRINAFLQGFSPCRGLEIIRQSSGPRPEDWRRKTEDQRPETKDRRPKNKEQRPETKEQRSKVYNSQFSTLNSQLYFTVLPSFTAFCGCIRLRVPSACSAINTIPCDSTPLMFFGARLMSISTCLPTRSCGS